MELYKGRPENIQGRLDKEIRVYDLLDSLGIEYERTDHERTDTMEACNEIDAILQVTICKNLFLCNRQKTNFYLLIDVYKRQVYWSSKRHIMSAKSMNYSLLMIKYGMNMQMILQKIICRMYI